MNREEENEGVRVEMRNFIADALREAGGLGVTGSCGSWRSHVSVPRGFIADVKEFLLSVECSDDLYDLKREILGFISGSEIDPLP